MEDLIAIGQFARASRLSPKALRLYDENGLLPPARVDPDSGYRFYRLEQLREATLIGLLRTAGMPLAQIRRVLDDPAPVRIDEYEAALAGELTERRRILDYVRRFLKEELMFEVKTKHVDEQPYESRVEAGPGRGARAVHPRDDCRAHRASTRPPATPSPSTTVR